MIFLDKWKNLFKNSTKGLEKKGKIHLLIQTHLDGFPLLF